MIPQIKLNLFFKVLFLFGVTQGVGIWLAYKILPELQQTAARNVTDFSLRDFMFFLIIGTFFIFIVLKFPRVGGAIYKVFLTILIFSIVQGVLALWTGPGIALGISILAVISFWFFRNVLVQDLIMVITLAGVAVVLGLTLTPLSVVIILVVLSFYDILAVYKTGHMVKLAELMVKSRAIFGFVIPEAIGNLKTSLKKVSPGEGFMILGSGDVILPSVLAISLVRVALGNAIIVAIFSAMGLFVTHLLFVNQQNRKPMAALPPIAAMSIIGYLITLL